MPHESLHLCGIAFADAPAPVSGPAIALIDLPHGTRARVMAVHGDDSPASRELVLRLLEIGFVEGEPVRVIARGQPGGEPVAVRVGGTTFALRRFEAERVMVRPEDPTP